MELTKDEVIEQLRIENRDLKEKLKLAEDIAEKLFAVNDVLCADLNQCERFFETIKMAVEHLHTDQDVLNRIAGPLV